MYSKMFQKCIKMYNKNTVQNDAIINVSNKILENVKIKMFTDKVYICKMYIC